ncbi:TIGR03915 family putative DNA repair protein [Flavobacterium turcicum]|uniref:TIGR03915 family putative DNA repair protein n=1 Tax=Flavobacterium turcicum TaxID=2764718 RepID=A0ABR7JE68_9FLAO|nr:TIGR03915 family putative DNA repair protein [Flavobacterium turcicum]MBC5862802.1 TIGR03915 family putative DNA repair protein [Flavobacterium turcicum]NHL01534.1 DNA metabolism protein [Flavobacterium turcicum]
MYKIIYDGTYEGWLTAVFDIYEYNLNDVFFEKENRPKYSLFLNQHKVITDLQKSERVLNGLKKRLSKDGIKRIYLAFLSEVDENETIMLRFVKYAFASTANIENDFSNSDVWNIRKITKFVKRETHRMKAFVRFMKTSDEVFFAIIEPDCDVLPLIGHHFKSRYADQKWLIFDAKRKYGIFYDLNLLSNVEVEFSNNSFLKSKNNLTIFEKDEIFYQKLWKRYFSAVNIESRKNTRLHLQHMPKRYWKHLIEKLPED